MSLAVRFAYRTLLLICVALMLSARARAQKSGRKAEEGRVAPVLVIRAQRMLDADRGQLVADAVVIVQGQRVKAAGSGLAVPAGAEVIELGDATLLPGLVDAHTHITYHYDETGHFGLFGSTNEVVALRYAAENARRTLFAGFTTIRNLGAGGRVDLRLRDAIDRGETAGPRLLVSGEPITPDDLSGVNDAATRLSLIRQLVRARIAEGVDVIKIFEVVDRGGTPLLSRQEIGAAVEEAGRVGLKVAVHAHEAAAVKAAVEGGCASVEHGTFLDEESARLMARRGTALVPTLYLPTHYLNNKSRFLFDVSTWEFFEQLRARSAENLAKARKLGVWIVAGSDAVAGLHGENARELVWLVKAGMSPAEAIRAATTDAAKLLGLDKEIGELKAGKLADLIAVRGDPLRDIGSLERVAFVMKGGQVFRTVVRTELSSDSCIISEIFKLRMIFYHSLV